MADGKDIVAVIDEISEKNHDITIISTGNRLRRCSYG